MIRALNTGISGLRTHQTQMDVVGNNIGNVNTLGFKRSRASFSEVLGQEMLGGSRSSRGTQASRSFVGLGTSVDTVAKNWNQGRLETTNIATDMALSGDGFFVVDDNQSQQFLTRAGNFSFNRDGELVTPGGLTVKGWEFDPQGNIDMSNLQDITIDRDRVAPPRQTANIFTRGNLASDAPTRDPAAGDDPNSQISTVAYDARGETHNVVIEFYRTQSVSAGDPSDEWTFRVMDPSAGSVIDQGTMTFDASGSMSQLDGTAIPGSPTKSDYDFNFNWDIDGQGGAESFNLNFGDENSSITQYSGSSTVTVRKQDGNSAGKLVGLSMSGDGTLRMNYSNGEQESRYQLAVGRVNNKQGLDQKGDNLYTTTNTSGEVRLGRAGQEFNTTVNSGRLEQSNVDLAQEFTDMIKAQRGYQASARVITTADEILQETVSLKR